MNPGTAFFEPRKRLFLDTNKDFFDPLPMGHWRHNIGTVVVGIRQTVGAAKYVCVLRQDLWILENGSKPGEMCVLMHNVIASLSTWTAATCTHTLCR